MICGLACLVALVIYFILMVRQFSRHYTEESDGSPSQNSRSRRLQTFLSFVDEKEEGVKGRSKRRQMEMASTRSVYDQDESMSSSKRRHIELSSNNTISTTDEI